MTVIGIDDTDSLTSGMCTTYVATELANRLSTSGATVSRRLLIRLNPAVEHKTRGNAALALHTDADPALATEQVESVMDLAATGDDRTNPGAVVFPGEPETLPSKIGDHAQRALREFVSLSATRRLARDAGGTVATSGSGRGLIGAVAAAGAWDAFDEWTYEHLSYRERDRWGSTRTVDRDSVFSAVEEAYPAVWDTVDRVERTAVCVPRTPCPVLHGIRGEDPETVETVAREIESESIARSATFLTNQGTDAHLQRGVIGEVQNGRSYILTGRVSDPPETREGGHVFVGLIDNDTYLQCVAFEPTKRFRNRVRNLRVGDRITVCGEVSDGTLKLEKFAVRSLVTTETVSPTCPGCGNSMASAGAGQGYRCRECGTTAPDKAESPLERDLDIGWYEVPPVARRHLAKPLVRGGFDAPIHPER